MRPLRLLCVRNLAVWLGPALLTAMSGCAATSGWMMNNSGMGYYQQGNYAMARHEFALAVAAAPWDADYRHNYAMAMKRMGDVAGAERVLRHNLTVDAMHQPTYHSLAQLYVEQGRQGDAQELLASWTGTQPYAPGAHIEMAWLQRETGNLQGAEAELRHALQLEPHNPIALAQLGQLYQDAGQPLQAAAMYERSLAMNYDQPQVQSRLAALENPRYAPGGRGLQMSALPPPAFPSAGPEMSAPGMLAGAPMMGAPMMGSQPMMPPPALASGPVHQPGPMSPAPQMMGAPLMAGAPPHLGQPPQMIGGQPVPIASPGGWMPAGSTTQIVNPPPTMISGGGGPVLPPPAPSAEPVILHGGPEMAAHPGLNGWQPAPASGTTIIQNADPAHAADMTATLPTVDPH